MYYRPLKVPSSAVIVRFENTLKYTSSYSESKRSFKLNYIRFNAYPRSPYLTALSHNIRYQLTRALFVIARTAHTTASGNRTGCTEGRAGPTHPLFSRPPPSLSNPVLTEQLREAVHLVVGRGVFHIMLLPIARSGQHDEQDVGYANGEEERHPRTLLRDRMILHDRLELSESPVG